MRLRGTGACVWAVRNAHTSGLKCLQKILKEVREASLSELLQRAVPTQLGHLGTVQSNMGLGFARPEFNCSSVTF